MDSIHLTLVFYTDKADFRMHVISLPVRFRSHAALFYFRCSFVPASPLPRWFLVSPATSPMLTCYGISPAPSQARRGYRICPAPSQVWRGYRTCPAPSQVRRGYRICPAPSPIQRVSVIFSAPDRCGQTILQNTVVACDDAREILRHSRVFYCIRELHSVVLKYVSVLFKSCVYSATVFYDRVQFFFVNICHLLTNVAEWSIQCRFSRFNSASSKARYIVLQLSRNLYLRHDFRALQTKFIQKTRQQEDLRNIFSLIIRVYRYGGRFVTLGYDFVFFWRHAHSCRPPWITRSSKASYIPKNLGVTKPQSNLRTRNEAPQYSGDIGGRRLHVFTYHDLEPYLTTLISSQNSHTNFEFVDHVDDIGALQYPKEQYVHAVVPLGILVSSLPFALSRKIVVKHGVTTGSRCRLRDLQALVVEHSCLVCSTHTSIFLPEDRRARASMKESEKQSGARAAVEFPPSPLDCELGHKIVSNACKKMSRSCFEELGCAVCGELKPLNKTSQLKSVKNLLHVLVSPGVTRKERKDATTPIQEYSGPALDYRCNKICDDCRKPLRMNKVPTLALANNLWIGTVPDELKCLRFVEKMLIARVRHTCSFVKVASGMRKMKANVVAFESPIPKIYNILPPPRDDLDDVLAILFTGPCKPSEADVGRTPFLVRRNHVMRALQWLKVNHCDYENIEISTENMEGYSETEPPVSIQYRSSIGNKAPEGTSVFDTEVEDGTEEGDCSFTVHGLTGENLDTMTTSAIKAQALRHLNNRGKFLLVGQSQKLESMWNNPQLYPQMFPWLFPYGLGGIGTTKLSDKEHKRHLLMYHDKRFQVDVNFPFVAFSHEQTKASTTQSFLLIDQNRFGSITDRLLNLDQFVLANIVERMAQGEHIRPETDAEKACFQVIRDLDHVAGKMHGSTTSKKYMRNQIWSLIARRSAPYWYITLSPADIQHPICIYFAQMNEEFKLDILPYDERLRAVCANPVAGARFFHFLIQTFISEVLGVDSDHRGLYGDTDAYYGTVEQQGRLTLHLHMLLWIKGGLSPKEMRRRLMDLDPDSQFQKKVKNWLESCFTGDFMTGTQEDVINMVAESSKEPGYADPTQTMPESPPPICTKDHRDKEICKPCSNLKTWWNKFRKTVDDILSCSNIHNCNRNMNKDGTRKKGASTGCMDNKWGKCKAHFPRPTAPETTVDPETGYLTMKKAEAWINTFTPIVTYLFRCNTDISSLSSGTAIKGVVLYISDYITKTSLKTHTIFESIRSVFDKNTELISGSLPMKEKARRIMTKVVNLLSAKMEIGAPMICMYLLGQPDHYTDHKFIPFYWQSFVSEARRPFDSENIEPPHKVTLIKRRGRIIGLSPVFDYIYRAPELDHLSLYEWITRCKRVKISKRDGPRKGKKEEPMVQVDADVSIDSSFEAQNESFQVNDLDSNISLQSEASSICDLEFLSNLDSQKGVKSGRKLGKNIYPFLKDHPLCDSHALQLLPENEKTIPDFVGATLPRCDQGDREFYCSTMLALFQPWHSGKDLKQELESWDEAFTRYQFSGFHKQLMSNFNIRYECLDARDDYRAQMKKGTAPLLHLSWDDLDANQDPLEHENERNYEDLQVDCDDVPVDLTIGKAQHNRVRQMETINNVLRNTGWTHEKPVEKNANPQFTPCRVLSGSEWRAEVMKKRQDIQDNRDANYQISKKLNKPNQHLSQGQENVVKVVDKSYLEKKFHSHEFQFQIKESVKKYSLNEEQERAFRIVANHAVSPCSEQLKMYIGGMEARGSPKS